MDNASTQSGHALTSVQAAATAGAGAGTLLRAIPRQSAMDGGQKVVSLASSLTSYATTNPGQMQMTPKPLQINLKPQLATANNMQQPQVHAMPAGIQLNDASRVISSGGQTFLLPSNVGPGDKVFIVNSPGRPPQAIALPASFQMNAAQLQAAAQQQQQQQQKQLYVLPTTMQSNVALQSNATNQRIPAAAQMIPNQQAVKLVSNQPQVVMATSSANGPMGQNAVLSSVQRSILPKPLSSQQTVLPATNPAVVNQAATAASRLSHFPLPAQKLAQQQLQDLQKSFSTSATQATPSFATSGARDTTAKQMNGLPVQSYNASDAQRTVPVNQQQAMTQQQLLQIMQLAQQGRNTAANQTGNMVPAAAAQGHSTTVTLQQLQQLMRSQQLQGASSSVPVSLSSDGKSIILQLSANNTVLSNQAATPGQLSNSQLQGLQQQLLAGKIIEQAQHVQPRVAAESPQRLQVSSRGLPSGSSPATSSRSVNLPINPSSLVISAAGGSTKVGMHTANSGQALLTNVKQVGTQGNKAIPAAQQKAMLAKRIQEQLKHLTPAQREQLIKHQQVLLIDGQQIPLAKLLQKEKPAEPSPAKTPKASKRNVEPEKKEEVVESKVSRRLKHCLNADQKRVVEPDYKKPFRSLEDALSRLLPYHVYYEEMPAGNNSSQGEAAFDAVATQLIRKRDRLRTKYNELMQDESQRVNSSAEMVMLERIFMSSEKAELEDLRTQAAAGTLLLPVTKASTKDHHTTETDRKRHAQVDDAAKPIRTEIDDLQDLIRTENDISLHAISGLDRPMNDLASNRDSGSRTTIPMDEMTSTEVNEATLNLMADFVTDEFNDEALLALQSLSSSL